MSIETKARDLFIVDNSVSGWTGLRYLEECWLIDVAARVTTSARRVQVHVADSARDLWSWALTRMGRLRPVT